MFVEDAEKTSHESGGRKNQEKYKQKSRRDRRLFVVDGFDRQRLFR
jgi:hypothetical protein